VARTPASPIACTCSWKPSASKASAAAASSSGVHTGSPQECVDDAGRSSYGASIAAVPASTTPSANIFTVRTDTWSATGEAAAPSRAATNSARWPVHRPGSARSATLARTGSRPGGRGRQVRLDVGRREGRLLHPGDPGSGEQGAGGGQPVLLLRRGRPRRVPQHQVHRRPLDQRPHRGAVGAARHLAGRRVRRVLVDAGPPQGLAVRPDAVVVGRLQHHRPVRHGGVQPARVEPATGRELGS
jgi:hypothetical protein